MGQVPAYRNFLTELGVAMGFIGLGLLGLQFLISGRFHQTAPSFGMDNILQFHREMGIIAFLFILAHPVTLILANPEFINYFNPTVNFMRAIALVTVTIAIIILLASSLWRIRFGLNYEWWRVLHGLLSLAVIFIGVVHSLQVAHYLGALWQQITIVLIFGFFAYLVVHTRLIRPWLSRRKPYTIKEVIEELGDCYTLNLVPLGHPGMQFRCGQFVWITIGETPFSLQQHPFSMASVCGENIISLTAKASGDFTSTWKNMKPGTKAFLEGPFGSFTPEEGKNLFMVMGGIGVTPGMSMLRTIRKNKEETKAILIYANPDWDSITFREELIQLQQEINLKIVHVLENPPENWDGETGFVDQKILEKNLPENPEEYGFYICGPKPMQDIAEISLRNLGIDWRLVYSERFEII
jgi:predicted ferric reductase